MDAVDGASSATEERLRLEASIPGWGGRHQDNVCRDFGVSRKAATSAWSSKARKSLDNPFGTRVSPMSQVRGVTCVSGPEMGFGICWRATPDDDEHYVYAMPL